MAESLDTTTNLINSPPGQLVAGGVLAGIVWKFFERVEAVLTEETKFEIAVWLVGVKTEKHIRPWPDTFVNVFTQVFGNRASLRCFVASCLVTLTSCVLCTMFLIGSLYSTYSAKHCYILVQFGASAAVLLVCFDYLALLETRICLSLMQRVTSASKLMVFLLADLLITGLTGAFPTYLVTVGRTVHPITSYSSIVQEEDRMTEAEIRAKPSSRYLIEPLIKEELDDEIGFNHRFRKRIMMVLWLPGFFTSIWLWLYAGSGFLLKAAKHFDIGFQWFNRKFDIEKKPLQSIGLVAGALVALAYWAAVIVSRVV